MVDLSQIEKEMARYREECADYLAELDEERWVWVMCDYSADGVWDKGGGSMDCTALPITPELCLRIRQWQSVYERLGRQGEFDDRRIDYSDFGAQGFAIAVEMKRQLPDWTVVYRDERRSWPNPTEAMFRRYRMAIRVRPELARAWGVRDVLGDHYRDWCQYEITREVLDSGLPPDNKPDGPPKWLAGGPKRPRKRAQRMDQAK